MQLLASLDAIIGTAKCPQASISCCPNRGQVISVLPAVDRATQSFEAKTAVLKVRSTHVMQASVAHHSFVCWTVTDGMGFNM